MPALRLMTFNVQLPSMVMAVGQGQDDGAEDRAQAVADALLALPLRDRPDVIAFNEVFNEDARKVLLQNLPAVWSHVVKKVDDGGIGEDSGLMLFSRFKFLTLPTMSPLFPSSDFFFSTYTASALPDAGAHKAVGMVRIDTPAQPTTLLFTHTQASYDGDNSENRGERRKQLDQIVEFVKTALGPSDSDWKNVILVGDMNIKGDPDAVTDEWNDVFKSGQVKLGQLFQDGWREHMHPPLGPDERDPGFTQRDTETSQLNRFDYQCFKILDPQTRQLVPHHMFQRLRELSDHWSQEARIQFFSANCTPATAIDFLTLLPVSVGPPTKVQSQARITTVTVQHEGACQWLYVARPGTYSLFNDTGFELAMFGEDDLTHPLVRLDSISTAELPPDVKAGLDRSKGLDPKGQTIVTRTPFFIRVRSKTEAGTGPCKVAILTHRGESQATAIVLLPHLEVDPQLPAGQTLGDDDRCWFRADIPGKFDMQPHTATFRLRNRDKVPVTLTVVDAALTSLPGPSTSANPEILAPVSSTEALVFLILKRASLTDVQFTMLCKSPLTFLLLDKPLHLHIDDETGPDAIGDDTLRLDLGVDTEHLFTETWDNADAGEDWPDLQKKIRDVATTKNGGSPTSEIVFSSEITVTALKLDGIAAHGSASDFITGLNEFDKDTEIRKVSLTISDPAGDGRITFGCTLSKFPAGHG